MIPGRKEASTTETQRAQSSVSLCALCVSVVIVFLMPTMASACPVCFGDPNSAMVKGANNGILVLLGIVVFVQLGLVALFWSFWRRGQALRRRREQFHLISGGVR